LDSGGGDLISEDSSYVSAVWNVVFEFFDVCVFADVFDGYKINFITFVWGDNFDSVNEGMFPVCKFNCICSIFVFGDDI